MRQLTISILIFISCLATYGQVKVNPTGKFFNYKGINIYYEDTGNGEPLLLLHNFYGTSDYWKPYIEPYSKRFRTIAIDMMGHGRSDIFKRDIHFKHEDYAKIVIALLDSLKLNNVNAIGASSGGITLLHLNILQPARFKSVISIGALYYFSKDFRDSQIKKGPDSVNVKLLERYTERHGAEKGMLLTRQFWQFHKSYGDPAFTPDILNTITAKWLVVHGDNDQSVPLQQALELHHFIPNSRLWIVPNGGHLPYVNPEYQFEFLKISLDFLDGKWDNKN